MSKSLWSRSVWNSLFSRISTSRRAARQRRKSLQTHRFDTLSAEMLEERVVPAVDVFFNSFTDTLTLSNNNPGTITIKAGSTYTDILVDGKFQTRLVEANSNNIGTIDYSGDTGTDTLNVIGVNGVSGSVNIILRDCERILLNTKNTTITADEALAFGKSTVAGTLTVTLDDGGVSQFGKVTVSGLTTIDTSAVGGNIAFSSSGNSFGTLILNAGTGAININETGPTTLGDSTDNVAITGSSLTVKSTGAITDVGDIEITGAVTLTSRGAITLDDPDSNFGGLMTLKGTNIAIDNDEATDLGNVTATGTFTLTSNGTVRHDGTGGTTGNIKIGGAASITVDNNLTQDILLTFGTNNFGSLSLDARDVSVTEKSATDLDTTTATRNLTIISKGAITDSGEITVGDDTSFTTTGNSDITLDENSSYGGVAGDFLALTGRNIAVSNDAAATELGAVSAKGTFTLESTGAVTQVAAATVIGRATVTAGNGAANIDLDNAGNAFGSVSVFGNNVEIDETGATNLYTSEVAGNLDVASTGAITDSGTIQVAGTTLIVATGAITLDSSDSFYEGNIDLSGTDVSITNIEATNFADLNASGTSVTATGNFTVICDEDVTDANTAADEVAVTGRLTVTTPGDIVLDNVLNTSASIAVSGGGGATGAVTIVDAAGGLDIVSASSVGTLSVTTTGALSDSGTVTVTGNTTVSATGGAIQLDSAASTYAGTVTVTTGTSLILVDSDANGLTLPSVTLTGGSGAVSLTAVGDITVTTISGLNTSLALNAGSSGSMTLNATSVAGNLSPVTLTGVNAALDLDNGAVVNRSVTLGNASLSGTLSLTGTALGDVAQVASTKLSIAGQVTIDTDDDGTDSDVTLNNIGNTFGTLVIEADDLTVREAAATDFGASEITANLTVVSSGAVTDSGTVTVDGTTSVTSTGSDIVLNSAANSFDGALTLTGANVTIQDDATSVLTAVTATGTFTLTTTGAVSQTGNVVVGGLATITGTTIDLDTAASTINFGSLALSGTNIDINEDSATNFASVNATTLDVLSGAAITDSGTLTVSSGATFKAGTSGLESITLDDASNSFGDLTFDGSNVTLVENGATTLTDGATSVTGGAASNSIDGNLTITSAGDVTHLSGGLTVLGAAAINSNSGTGTVTLSAGSNNFNTISVTAGSATIDEDSATDLAGMTVTGAFNLTSTGSITDSGVVTLGGAAVITATGGDVELDEENSSYFSVDISGASVKLLAYSSLQIEDADSTAGDIVIIATGSVTDNGHSTIDSAASIFLQAGMDTSDPTRELDPTDPSDQLLLNTLNITGNDPTFVGTETYVGSFTNVVTGPFATITLSDASIGAGETATVTIMFSEAVTDFSNADVAVESGALSTLVSSDGGVTWTGTFTPTVATQVDTNAITVDAGGYTDLVGNPGASSTSDNYVVDTVAPSTTSIVRQTPSTSPTNANTLVFRVTFSEAVTGVGINDFAVTVAPAPVTPPTVTAVTTVSATQYDVTVSGGDLATLNATVGLNIAAVPTVQDQVGNALPTGEPVTDQTYAVDNTAPTTTSILRQTPSTSPTNANTLVFRVTFSEAVTGVGIGDFAVSGTSATATAVAPVSTSVYDITVSGGNLAMVDATVGLTVSAATINDLAGNAQTVFAAGTTETYVVDNTAPTVTTVTVGTPTITSGDLIQEVTVNFSEAMDQGAFDPVITFLGTAGVWTTNNDGAWNVAGTQWTESFTVTDVNETVAVVTIDVTGTQDLAGNTQVDYTPEDEFDVNTTI